jgi:hypothetical protein
MLEWRPRLILLLVALAALAALAATIVTPDNVSWL